MRRLIAIFLVGILSGPCWAVSVRSEVSASSIGLGESVTYKVIIESDSLSGSPKITFPSFPDSFRVIGPSSSKSIQIVNGQVQSFLTQYYVLVPQQKGVFSFEPSVVNVGSEEIRTTAHQLTVTDAPVKTSPAQGQGQALPQQSHIFAQAEVDKPSVYVGEKLDLKMTFYRQVRLWSDIAFDIPEINGVWTEKFPVSQQETLVRLGGKQFYKRDLLHYVVFPLSAGRLDIPSIRVGFVVSPFDGQQVVQTTPVSVTVKPLPESGKPASFSGVVGEFLMTSTLNTTVVQQHAPVTLTVSLSGEGNLKNIQGIHVPQRSDLKVYQSNITDYFDTDNGVSGNRVFEYVVIPKKSGSIVIPAFEFAYFSPQAKQYVVLKTPEYALTVSPAAAAASGVTGELQGLTPVVKELSYLRPAQDVVRESRALRLLGWVFLAINVGVSLVWFGMGARDRFYRPDAMKLRQNRAAKQAIQKIDGLAQRHPLETAKLYQVLIDYLSDKTLMSFNKLGRDGLVEALREAGLSQAMCDRVSQQVDTLSYAAYAPQKQDGSALVSSLKQLIGELEDAL